MNDDPSSLIKKWIFELILETCENVFYGEIKVEAINEIKSFANKVECWTADIVTSIPLLLGRTIAFKEIDLTQKEIAGIEESDRWNYSKDTAAANSKDIVGILFEDFKAVV